MEEFGKQGEVESWIRGKPLGWVNDRGRGRISYFYVSANENRIQSKLGPGCIFVGVCQWP